MGHDVLPPVQSVHSEDDWLEPPTDGEQQLEEAIEAVVPVEAPRGGAAGAAGNQQKQEE